MIHKGQNITLLLGWQILFIAATTFTICSCVEEEEPEVFLPPRNFNPHPYQAGYEPGSRSNGNTGPVLFPATETSQQSAVVNVDPGSISARSRALHPIDSHPYASVAKRHRYRQGGRWQLQDNHVNPQVYNALAAHAAKVLNKPASTIHSEYSPSSLAHKKKNYAFSYKVVDHLTGDDFSHTQSQNAQATNGEYRVKLPDGRVQIVSYTADKNGYKADVKYAENESLGPKQHYLQQIENHPIQATQNEIERSSKLKADQYDYIYNDLSRSNLQSEVAVFDENVKHLPVYVPIQTSLAAEPKINHNEYITATIPTPLYHREPQESAFDQHKHDARLIYTNKFQVIPAQKFQLFEQQKVTQFISSTLAPYTVGSSKDFQQNVVSTLSPDLDRYSQVYTNKPKFAENRQPGELYYVK